jgi:SAM-dependent methyltransferase
LSTDANQSPSVAPPRPDLDERREYAARGRQEEFIVPLLRGAIEGAIAQAEEAWKVRAGATDRVPRVLDVGCGGQPFRGALLAAGFNYHAIDTQAQAGVMLDGVCAIDEPLPPEFNALAGPGFDLVLCTEVLEHVLDWPAAWTNLGRLLAPGGRLIITCPFIYPLHEEPYDFWRPTPHALRRFAERYGLQTIEQRTLGDGFDALGTINAASTPDPSSRDVGAKLLSMLAKKGRKLLHALLKSPRIRRALTARSKLYVANFIVLAKPGSSGGAA